MNTDINEDPSGAALPIGWILCPSKSNPGRKYYFNRKTGKSSWTKPQDGETSSESQKSKRKKAKEKEEILNAMDDLLTVNKVPPKKNMKRKSDESASVSVPCLQNKKKKQGDAASKHTNQVNVKPKLTPIKRLNTSSVIPSTKSNTSAKTTVNLAGRGIANKEATAGSVAAAKRPYSSTNTSSTSVCASKKPYNSASASAAKKQNTGYSKRNSRPTPPGKKNIAQDRMSRLRADLSSESIEDDRDSPRKSPNTSHTESKPAKLEIKSPNLNESKCSVQSPNDSVQSAPSPSQFFAANKIISSMKAQLPEEYSLKEKQKDTFADIEQGIYNQVTEYPYMKHPATPPQFSEASKLVSAIKSKLSYKSKETPVRCNSANERLNSLRRTLSSEAMDIGVDRVQDTNRHTAEAMEVDPRETNVPAHNSLKDSVSSKENIVLVVDTNIFIQELDFIKKVMNSHIKEFNEPPMLLVPWRVINELDKLKDSNNGKAAICKRARPAMDYLYKYLPENDRIKVQPLRDANSHIYPCESPDDEILNCCLQQAERGKSVILLSNDKNLCTKAVANGVQHRSLRGLQLEPSAEPPAAPDAAARVIKHIYTLLANILENEMRAKYDDIWERVVFSPPPWSLSDVLQCLLKHWIAVFRDVFPRIEHLITELKDSVASIERKASKNITQSELSNFKDLCLDVAKHCQIIPEYMELAKKTVARLQRDRASESDDEQEQTDKDGDNVVIEAFEGVWTVFSSYCAKLATGLGISHSVEDKLASDDTVDVLTGKLSLFGNHVATLTDAIGGILPDSLSEQELEEQVSRLESAFKDSLGAIGVDGTPVNRNNLRVFSTKCRIMLQEAHSKFTQLVELLQLCKNNLELPS